jgi:hypothetical protein
MDPDTSPLLLSAFRRSVRGPDACDGIDDSVRGDDIMFHAGGSGDGGEELEEDE